MVSALVDPADGSQFDGGELAAVSPHLALGDRRRSRFDVDGVFSANLAGVDAIGDAVGFGRRSLGLFQRRHCQAFAAELGVVQFRLFLGADPNRRLTFVVNLVGEFPGAIARHPRNVLHQAVGDVLKGIKIVVEDDHFIVGIRLADGLAGTTRSRGRRGSHGSTLWDM